MTTIYTRSTFGKSNMFAPALPSAWQRIQQDPILFVAQWLYAHRPPSTTPKPASTMHVRIVCISDTHNEQPHVPNGEILIHAGDLTVNGTFKELQSQLDWLNSLPHQHKVMIAGNHDLLLDPSFFIRNPRAEGSKRTKQELCWGSITYLCNSSATLDIRGQSYHVYGSPMTPKNGNWAFQYPGTDDIWSNTVPEATDILVTHGPAKGHLDSSPANPSYLQGCAHFQRELWRVKPRLHVFGHIHSARGAEYGNWGWLRWDYNAVCCSEGGVGVVLRMLANWAWLWVLCMLGRAHGQTMTSVNAAVVGENGLAEGEQTLLVDLR